MDGTLSLRFELRGDETADLEAAASAAIAWCKALRAAAKAIDPTADIRIGIVDADRSSLIWNTVIDWIAQNIEPHLERIESGGVKIPRVRKLAIAFAVFVIFTAGPTYLAYFGDNFTAEDRAKIDELVEIVRKDQAAEAARRRFFQALEKEPAITAVSVRELPHGPDIISIPSSQFAEAGGLWADAMENGDPKVSRPVMNVVLVRPALSHSPRAWTFKPEGLPEFEATMRDPEILKAMASDQGLPLAFREDVPMTIELEVTEQLIDGEWKLVRGGRSVTRVIDPQVH